MQIYIHIPFCEQKCSYCRFASIGKVQKYHIEKYVSFLCEEICRGTPCGCPVSSGHPQGVPLQEISTIYFGGGTPGVLSIKQLQKIFSVLKKKFIFSEDIEITLESTPDKITPENIKGWSKLGINRLSMGVQTLNSKSLETIGRGKKGDIEKALDICREGLQSFPTNISLDFIIGLPYVKKGEILEDIKYILEKYNFIKHISVYMLEDYYNADKIRPHPNHPLAGEGRDKEEDSKFQKITYPENWGKLGIDEKEYLGEYSKIRKYLKSQGFERYEISNYAKSGCRCKHNIGYWNHSEILGFGLGAYGLTHPQPLPGEEGSNFDFIRYANSENFGEYYQGKRILENRLTEEDLFLETVMFQLRTSGLEEKVYKKLDQEKIQYFIENGYLEKKDSLLTKGLSLLQLTDSGVLVMDYILGEIVL